MNQKYELVTVEALKFVKNDKDIFLIDTGSPYSFFKKNEIEIDGVIYKSSGFNEILKDRMEKLSQMIQDKIEYHISGLIGLDIILDKGFTINIKERYVSFSFEEIDTNSCFDYTVKSIKGQNYIIFNDVDVLGMTKEGSHPFILDTGACVSIFRQNICTHAQYAYRREYYYPSLGRTLSSDFMFFTLTQKCQLKVIAGASIDNDLNNQLDFLDVDGELCFNDFEYDILSIDIKNKQILWK